MKLLFLIIPYVICAINGASGMEPLQCHPGVRYNETFEPLQKVVIICDFKDVNFDQREKIEFNVTDLHLTPIRIRFIDCYAPQIPSDVFEKFRKLEILEITKADLKYLHQHSLNDAKELLVLKANNNKIVRIPNRMFQEAPKLEYLDLSSNSIAHINGGAFSGLSSLKELGLSNNQIEILDEDTFKPLTGLTWIWLDRNKLRIISANLLLNSQNLKGIYLNDNRISALSPVLFDNLPELRFLFLAGNNCTNRNYLNYKVPFNTNIKKDLVKCYEEYRMVIPNEEEQLRMKVIIDNSEKALAECEDEKVKLMGRLENALQQMGNKKTKNKK